MKKDLRTLTPIVEYEKLLLSYKTATNSIFDINYTQKTAISIKIKTLENIRDFILEKLPNENIPTFLDFAHNFYLMY